MKIARSLVVAITAWPGFLTTLLALSTWALFVGVFFAWLPNRLMR